MSNARRHETEAEFVSAIREFAQLREWLVIHQLRSKGTEAGWPDLVLLRVEPYPRLIFAEVKGPKGKLTDEQLYVLEVLRLVRDALLFRADEACKGRILGVYCWWPEDWELIQQVLE